MSDDTDARLSRLEAAVDHVRQDVADIKSSLSQLLPMIVKTMETMARLEGRMSDMPTARDFGRLEGRVAEMSERLPTTIGYTPPRSASGG